MKQWLANGEPNLIIVGRKMGVKKHIGGIQLKCLHMNANESDSKNELTPKKGGGF